MRTGVCAANDVRECCCLSGVYYWKLENGLASARRYRNDIGRHGWERATEYEAGTCLVTQNRYLPAWAGTARYKSNARHGEAPGGLPALEVRESRPDRRAPSATPLSPRVAALLRQKNDHLSPTIRICPLQHKIFLFQLASALSVPIETPYRIAQYTVLESPRVHFVE